MKLGRFAVAALALTAVFAAPKADAANGSNYLHLINGVDYFFGKTPPAGNLVGIWRCFPSSLLHSPTLDVNPANPTFGTYATELCAIHITVTASAGSLIAFPTIALSSSLGKCDFLTSAGTVNYGLFSVVGFGTIIAGPLTNNQGPVAVVNLLAGVAGASIVSPSTAPNQIVQLALNLVGAFGQTIPVPEGESLVLWVQDDPNSFGAGTMQYWTGSLDERNLCSGYSFLFSASTGLAFFFVPNFEWSIGLGTQNATMTTAITSAGPGPSSLNAHDALQGFNPGFDQGTGTRTISITGAGLGAEFLGVAIYDEANVGSGRLAALNCAGFSLAGATCDNRSATFLQFTGGPGGPVLSGAIPEMPRSSGKIDGCTNVVLGNAIWVLSTNHNTAPGSMNIPWFPAAAGTSGSNGTGLNGGFVIPIPPLAVLIGVELWFWDWPTDPTNSFLDFTVNNGHSNTNTYDVLFFP